MTWEYTIIQSMVYVTVRMNGESCGNLLFTKEQFNQVKQRAMAHLSPISSFEQTPYSDINES